VMAFPIKKRINTELVIDERAELHVQRIEPNFLTNLKRVKMLAPKPTIDGNETIIAACLK